MEEKYIAIIADLIDSKKIKDREIIQKKLKETLDIINQKYQSILKAKFIITVGDEIEGLLIKSDQVVDLINDLELLMFPTKFRIGIGLGDITTEIIYDKSNEIDGSAYHYARFMIEELERTKNQYENIHTNIMYMSSKKDDFLVNTIYSLLSVIKEKWTSRQVEIIKTYLNSEENQYKCAKILGISQSTVNRSIKSSNYYALKLGYENIKKYIGD